MINKSYKFRLYPNKEQRILLEKHFGSCRWIYNHFLQIKIDYYNKTKKTIGWVDLANQIPKLKEEYLWLKEIGSQSIQSTIRNLDNAYTNFFRSHAKFPKFKSKKNPKRSFSIPEGNSIKIDLENNKLSIPKFINLKSKDNRIKCIFHREIEGNIKQCTISKNACNQYFVSILVEQNIDIPLKPEVDENKAIGIDFGVRTFITFDNGNKIQNPKHLKQSLDKLKKHQQELELLEKDTTKHKSKKENISKLHNKIKNQRKDYLDKLTYKLTHDNQVDTICIENLDIKEMKDDNNSSTNRNIDDYSWGMFTRLLQYKSDWYGKNFFKIGKFDPSSKLCHSCGNVNHELKRDDYEWICPRCNVKHDRDINAAINIKNFALHEMKFNTGRNYPIEASAFNG